MVRRTSPATRTPRATFRITPVPADVEEPTFPRGGIAHKAPAADALDVADIRARLLRLRNYAHVPPRDLPERLKEDHRALVAYANVTYNIPQEYSKFYEIVTDVFSPDVVPDNTLKPGTVGTFYAGCRDKRSDDEVCSVTCAGSLPRPDLKRCDRTVLRAVYTPPTPGANSDTSAHMKYEVYNVSESDPEHALLYVPSDTFRGIYDKAANFLRDRYGVKKVRLIRYNEGENMDAVAARAMNSESPYIDLEALRIGPGTPHAASPRGAETHCNSTQSNSDENATRATAAPRPPETASEQNHATHPSRACTEETGTRSTMPWWAYLIIALAAAAVIIALVALIVVLLRGVGDASSSNDTFYHRTPAPNKGRSSW